MNDILTPGDPRIESPGGPLFVKNRLKIQRYFNKLRYKPSDRVHPFLLSYDTHSLLDEVKLQMMY